MRQRAPRAEVGKALALPASYPDGMRLGSAWVFVLALGCSSNETPPSNTGGGGASGTGGGAGAGTGGNSDCAVTLDGSAEPVFEQPTSRIRVYAGSDFTVVDGAVLDGPRREIHTESARSGDCRLLTYDSPSFCDPRCDNPQICVDGACERFPEPVSAGVLSVQLGATKTVEVSPNELGRYYWGSEEFGYESVPSVAVDATGFQLAACLSPPPQPTSDWSQLMQQRAPGEDVELAWSNPVATARVHLRMTTCIGTHGGISPVEIECEGRDEGKLTLPGAYLDAFFEDAALWGRGECGSHEVWRYHASATGTGPEAVQLRAEARASFYFQPGRGPL